MNEQPALFSDKLSNLKSRRAKHGCGITKLMGHSNDLSTDLRNSDVATLVVAAVVMTLDLYEATTRQSEFPSSRTHVPPTDSDGCDSCVLSMFQIINEIVTLYFRVRQPTISCLVTDRMLTVAPPRPSLMSAVAAFNAFVL